MDEDISINGYENELIQVIMNIIYNAKDALVKNDIKKRLIFISIYKKNQKGYLEIKDNAGGISLDIIGKIFDPYFTTKHQSQGTGMGLYNSFNMIENMEGTIEVENCEYEYENKKYSGAKFIIYLPIKNRRKK